MFKKLVACVLGFLLLCSIAGCTAKQENPGNPSQNIIDAEDNQTPNTPTDDSTDIEDNEDKPGKEIEHGTPYTNGLAFVKFKGDDKNYCIDKKGNIVFELPSIVYRIKDNGSVESAVTTGFYHGIALISDFLAINGFTTICTQTGEITTAEDLGVEFFLTDALQDGYIIAVTAGPKSEDNTIGILDANLNWVIGPSSEIVKSLGMTYGVSRSTRFYHNYILYGPSASVNIQTGEFSSASYRTTGKRIQASLPDHWVAKYDGYYDCNQKLVIDTNNYQDSGFATVFANGAKFANGKAPILFGHGNAVSSFSVIDTNGETQFEPISFGEEIDYIEIDGNYIFVVGKQSNSKTTARIYDLNGNLISELDPKVIIINAATTFQDGVVKVSFAIGTMNVDGSMNVTSWVKYFGTDLQPLF